MQAISISTHGGPDVLRVVDLAIPTPTADQVLVRNHAIGVNFVDVQHRQGGIYAVALPLIPGIEAAGVVEAVGPGATAFRPGDRVAYAGYMGGDYAEYTLVVESHLFPVPDAIDFETAAAISLQGITAHALTHQVYRVRPGDWVLIHAAAGGVGGLLLQIAKHLGARPIAAVSTEAKARFAREHGAEHAILYSTDHIVHTIDRLTSGAGVHVVYDAVGRDMFDASLASLRKRGTLVIYGLSSGPVPHFDINRLSGITPGSGRGSLSLIWAAASHYIEDRQELLAQTRAVFDLVQIGSLRPTIAGRLPLAEAAQAHRLLESRAVVGKLLLIPQGR